MLSSYEFIADYSNLEICDHHVWSHFCLNYITTYFFFSFIYQVHASELYLRDSDPLEVYNVAYNPHYQDLVQIMKKKLIAGWRSALPK